MFYFNLRKIDNHNKWKNYLIVAQVKLNLKLDALVIREQSNISGILRAPILDK